MEDIIAGKHAVLEALKSGRAIHKLWIAETMGKQQMSEVASLAKKQGIAVQFADKRKLDQLAGPIRHQGVVAQAAAAQYAAVEDLLSRAAERGETPFLIILDEIEDPHNLGSILRSADCTGVHGIIIPKRRSAGLNATVAKTSAGAVEYVPVARVANLAQTMDRLKKEGLWMIGADANAAQEIYAADLTVPLAVVIGSEGQGIGRLVREKCDVLVKLPMMGRINSLNASVAAAVCMYEIVRQRRAKA